ncbi:MAG: RNA methyltransferase [Leptospiraceae bacterium]|nr:RNA methyltransferase [Leptospiraceae bacterium]
MSESTLTICGLASVRSVAKETPSLIERLFFTDENAPLFADACRYLAGVRKTYRMVSGDELRKITDTAHHQGAAAIMRRPEVISLTTASILAAALCLHDVMNPHNIGAIARTAAFFGMQQMIVSRKTYEAAMTASAWRVAEGGLTHMEMMAYDSPAELFAWAESRARLLAAVKPEKNRRRTLTEFLRDKNKGMPVVCLGNEEDGLPAEFVSRCSGHFTIPGSGKVESLNVSVAAALCIHELARHHSGRGPE